MYAWTGRMRGNYILLFISVLFACAIITHVRMYEAQNKHTRGVADTFTEWLRLLFYLFHRKDHVHITYASEDIDDSATLQRSLRSNETVISYWSSYQSTIMCATFFCVNLTKNSVCFRVKWLQTFKWCGNIGQTCETCKGFVMQAGRHAITSAWSIFSYHPHNTHQIRYRRGNINRFSTFIT